MKGATLAFSVGPWGGFYYRRRYSTRLCVGWFAVTFIPWDADDLLDAGLDALERRSRA